MVRKANKNDIKAISEMGSILFDYDESALYDEFIEIFDEYEMTFFVKEVDGEVVGFCQCSLRHDHVNGTETSPVGFLEGIFVKETHRHKGYATELLKFSEAWAKQQNCTEFGSDCLIDNIDSYKWHIASGFDDVERVICFVKRI